MEDDKNEETTTVETTNVKFVKLVLGTAAAFATKEIVENLVDKIVERQRQKTKNEENTEE